MDAHQSAQEFANCSNDRDTDFQGRSQQRGRGRGQNFIRRRPNQRRPFNQHRYYMPAATMTMANSGEGNLEANDFGRHVEQQQTAYQPPPSSSATQPNYQNRGRQQGYNRRRGSANFAFPKGQQNWRDRRTQHEPLPEENQNSQQHYYSRASRDDSRESRPPFHHSSNARGNSRFPANSGNKKQQFYGKSAGRSNFLYSERHDHNDNRSNYDNERLLLETTKDLSLETVKDRPQFHQTMTCRKIHSEDDGTQRERLTEALTKGTYECMVCCEKVREHHEIWNCQNCYNIFHLWCTKKWARSSMASSEDSGWRCPGCQNLTEKVPYKYVCFCQKMVNPEVNRYDTPHSCGEQCGKKRKMQQDCIHRCNILCHPGPCPPCGVYVTRSCPCGKTSQKVRCGEVMLPSCGKPCEKLLNCGKHNCQAVCHLGSCDACNEVIHKVCFCEKQNVELPCNEDTIHETTFSCGSKCRKLLSCGNHHCDLLCHPGDCPSCDLSPDVLTKCPCNQTLLSDILPSGQPRTKCTDPIPTCDKACDKILPCGPEEDHHRCQSSCHLDPCPPCPMTSSRKCRCGSLKKSVLCSEITASDSLILCEKRCNKKKTCGRHKCSQVCCVDIAHTCDLICGRKLKCGLHNCDEPCHLGNCRSCWNTSFDELACHCGSTVMYPPIPCGTRPPECDKPCARHHDCDHPIRHNCHSESVCPPCTFLTEKWCYGEHELRTCIPCFQTDVCCGLPCNKSLSCGQHKCIKVCHTGPCFKEGQVCNQPCSRERPQCGHPCGAPCHIGECPSLTCKTMVSVKCKCGNRTGTMICSENLQAYKRLISSVLASRQHQTSYQGQTMDLTDAAKEVGLDKTCSLDCNEECAQIEKNRRFALGLQIRNPDLTCKLKPPVYSDFLKEQTKLNLSFISSIYNKLTELVESAKQSKQKSRSHAFAPMKSDHRRVIHELAEFFGCETQSYDEEPKKNVVATAFRDKSWLPSASIMTVVQKEITGTARQAGKAPPPISHRTLRNTTQTTNSIAATPAAGNGSNGATTSSTWQTSEKIDYFDFTD